MEVIRLLVVSGTALFLSFHAVAQLPDAPRPHRDRIETALIVANAGVRGLDAYSTRRALSRGNVEDFLPGAIVNRNSTMAAYSLGIAAADAFAASRLERSHWRFMGVNGRMVARILTSADAAGCAPYAIHNLYLKRQPPTSVR